MDEEKKELIILVKMLLLFLLIFTFFSVCSCTTTKYIEKEVPIETTKTEYKTDYKYDSIYIHDSINIYFLGDTIYKDKIKIVFKEKRVTDTVKVMDLMERPVYVNRDIVTNEISKTQKFFIMLGKLFLGIVGVLCLVIGIRYKFKKL